MGRRNKHGLIEAFMEYQEYKDFKEFTQPPKPPEPKKGFWAQLTTAQVVMILMLTYPIVGPLYLGLLGLSLKVVQRTLQ